MIPQSLHFMLGLCQRAGKAASGEFAVEQVLKKGKGELLILAEDASQRTRHKFLALADQMGVPCYETGTRAELGTALGKSERAAVVIQSRDFATGIRSILRKQGQMPLVGRG